MKRAVLRIMLVFSILLSFAELSNATIIIVCNGNDATVHVDDDGCNSCVETYGCNTSTY